MVRDIGGVRADGGELSEEDERSSLRRETARATKGERDEGAREKGLLHHVAVYRKGRFEGGR